MLMGITYATIDGAENCQCHKCTSEKVEKIEKDEIKSQADHFFAHYEIKMILCPKCGNKRCPHASDHRLGCTNSNEPGQHGSIYQ